MRNAFAAEVTDLASEDPRVVLLSGDIGNRLFDTYKEQHQDRFFNCGVAEANMIGIAGGMALNGLRPIAYTIASFLIYRPFEQIRIDVGYHNLPVLLVGVGGGLSYASNGGTHQSMEDVSLMQSIPGMQVICAGDAWEVRAGLRAAIESNQPTYLRIGKKNEPKVHAGILDQFRIGRAIEISGIGVDGHVLACGNLLPEAQIAISKLSERGLKLSLHSFHTVSPLDTDLLKNLVDDGKPVFVVEEHSKFGGLGAGILSWANSERVDARSFHLVAAPHAFIHRTANQKEARELIGLDAQGIERQILNFLK